MDRHQQGFDIFALIALGGFLLLVLYSCSVVVDAENESAALGLPKRSVGELASWSHGDNETVLSLTDGTQIRVEGRFGILKAGMQVQTTRVPSAQNARFYCTQEECRRLHR